MEWKIEHSAFFARNHLRCSIWQGNYDWRYGAIK